MCKVSTWSVRLPGFSASSSFRTLATTRPGAGDKHQRHGDLEDHHAFTKPYGCGRPLVELRPESFSAC